MTLAAAGLVVGLALLLVVQQAELGMAGVALVLLAAALGATFAGRVSSARARKSRTRARQIEQRYEMFVRGGAQGIWRIELDRPMSPSLSTADRIEHFYRHGALVEVNQAFVDTFGLDSVSAAVTMPLRTLFPPNRRNSRLLVHFFERDSRLVDAIFETPTPAGRSVTVRCSAYGTVESTVESTVENTGESTGESTGEKEELIEVWGTVTDITREQKAIGGLERSERLLASAERVAQTGSWTYDVETEEIAWSDYFYEMCGVDPEGFRPSVKSVGNAFHRDDRERWYRALRHTAETGEPLDEELRIFRGDGEMRYLDTRAEPLLDSRGRPTVLIGVSRDITRRKRIEMARHDLELQVRQLQKLEAIGTLAGGIAHDFNNILGATMGYTDMALVELDSSHPAHGYLVEIEKASLRAKDLVEQILSYSRHVERQRETVALDGVVREALGLMRASLPASIEIREELRARDAHVHCDGSQIHQVVVNLCTNASHAMAEGGVLRVGLDHIRTTEPLAATTGELPAGAYARLRLADTGHGMDAKITERIFDPFFTTKAPGEGTGLGLSTVQGIVLDHAGGIAVRSQPGEGTTFEIYLPIADDLATARQSPRAAARASHDETVLFLDDEASLMTLGEKMLGRLGYRALAFNSAIAALDAFRQEPGRFDLVITDLRMPEMSGLEVAQAVRQIRPDARIVLSTGFSDPQLEEHVADGMVQGTLLKPFNLATMGQCVRRALDRPAGEGQPGNSARRRRPNRDRSAKADAPRPFAADIN